MAADYASWSPYNYVLGNPIKFIDPDGRAPQWPPGNWELFKLGLKELDKKMTKVADNFWARYDEKFAEPMTELTDKVSQKISDYFAEGDHIESGKDIGDVGEGITVLSNSGKNSTGSIGTSNGETSTAIIETGELLTPGAGNDRSFARNLAGQPVNFIKNTVDATDNIISAVDRATEGLRREPADSICNSCNNAPHGLPYRRVDTNGSPIDTITPNE